MSRRLHYAKKRLYRHIHTRLCADPTNSTSNLNSKTHEYLRSIQTHTSDLTYTYEKPRCTYETSKPHCQAWFHLRERLQTAYTHKSWRYSGRKHCELVLITYKSLAHERTHIHHGTPRDWDALERKDGFGIDAGITTSFEMIEFVNTNIYLNEEQEVTVDDLWGNFGEQF